MAPGHIYASCWPPETNLAAAAGCLILCHLPAHQAEVDSSLGAWTSAYPLFPPQSDAGAGISRHSCRSGCPSGVPKPRRPGRGGNDGASKPALWFDLRSEGGRTLKEVLASVVAEYRPVPHRRNLEYMDLVAVKECTDQAFLPATWSDLEADEVDRRLDQLKRELGLA